MVSRRRGQKVPPKDDELVDFEISSQLVGTGAYSTIWRAYSKKGPFPINSSQSEQEERKTNQEKLLWSVVCFAKYNSPQSH